MQSSLLKMVGGGLVFLAGFLLGGLLLAPPTPTPIATAQVQPAGPSAEERLRQLKLELPPVKKPTNTLVSAVRVGDMLYVSGTGPSRPDGKRWTGRLARTLWKIDPLTGNQLGRISGRISVKEGQQAARQVGLQVLSVVKAELGSLDKVERVVKTLGMVNATPDFTEHPQVINGFSDLMVEVFGEKAGKGARSAVGMSSLPGGIPVEIEAIFQVRK